MTERNEVENETVGHQRNKDEIEKAKQTKKNTHSHPRSSLNIPTNAFVYRVPSSDHTAGCGICSELGVDNKCAKNGENERMNVVEKTSAHITHLARTRRT